MDIKHLERLTSSDLAVGIGLVAGDNREEQVLEGADFCKVKVFREAPRMLDELARGRIAAAVRGSLASGPFLKETGIRHPGVRTGRAALIVTRGSADERDGNAFLLGPVGIDEGGTIDANRPLVAGMKDFAGLLGWDPRIAVLSAGRAEDAGRGHHIARSIRRGEAAAADESVRHFNIMIEEAVVWANCIIAPDGVTGNLIYRTLVHLGGATSLGALYFPLDMRLADTSRNGKIEEYVGAIALANIAAGRRQSSGGRLKA